MDLPSVKEVVYVAPRPEWSFPLHSHENSAELSLVLSGRGSFYAASKEHTIEKGMMVVKDPGVSHSERSDPNDPLEQICIEVSGVKVDGLPDGHVIPAYVDPPLPLGEDFEVAAAAFRYLMDNYKDPQKKTICGKLLDAVLYLVVKKAESFVPPRDRKHKSKKELVSEVLQYLDVNYRNKLRIKDIADRFYVSEGNLSRQFKAVTGYTVNEYVISKRMGEAQRLLIYSDEDIKDVAAQSGYEDLQYFYHVFKSFAHCTPAEFREEYRE